MQKIINLFNYYDYLNLFKVNRKKGRRKNLLPKTTKNQFQSRDVRKQGSLRNGIMVQANGLAEAGDKDSNKFKFFPELFEG